MQNDTYFTIKKKAVREIKIKGSRFIGAVSPVKNEKDALVFVRQISKNHHAATHNCYAFQIGSGEKIHFRFNDNGEPSGTAGKPILNALQGLDLTDTVCVVTRYFGGTKLGTGGLARAYSQSASEVLKQAGRIKKHLKNLIKIEYNYHHTGNVMRLVEEYQGKIISSDYDQHGRMTLEFHRSKSEHFQSALINATAGNVKILTEEEPPSQQ